MTAFNEKRACTESSGASETRTHLVYEAAARGKEGGLCCPQSTSPPNRRGSLVTKGIPNDHNGTGTETLAEKSRCLRASPRHPTPLPGSELSGAGAGAEGAAKAGTALLQPRRTARLGNGLLHRRKPCGHCDSGVHFQEDT